MRPLFFLLALFSLGDCGTTAQLNIGNSSAEKAKRAAMCKERCNKEHYPDVKLIRTDGTVEIYKINIVSITGKTACECRF